MNPLTFSSRISDATLTWFKPVSGAGAPYGVDATAKCGGGDFGYPSLYGIRVAGHGAPGRTCLCGFNAYAEREKADGYPGTFMLEVDLFGTVIVHESGYRASRQRVLAMHVPAECTYCTRRAQGLVLWLSDPLNSTGIAPSCEHHANDEIFLSLSDVATKLGTEVRWAA